MNYKFLSTPFANVFESRSTFYYYYGYYFHSTFAQEHISLPHLPLPGSASRSPVLFNIKRVNHAIYTYRNNMNSPTDTKSLSSRTSLIGSSGSKIAPPVVSQFIFMFSNNINKSLPTHPSFSEPQRRLPSGWAHERKEGAVGTFSTLLLPAS